MFFSDFSHGITHSQMKLDLYILESTHCKECCPCFWRKDVFFITQLVSLCLFPNCTRNHPDNWIDGLWFTLAGWKEEELWWWLLKVRNIYLKSHPLKSTGPPDWPRPPLVVDRSTVIIISWGDRQITPVIQKHPWKLMFYLWVCKTI